MIIATHSGKFHADDVWAVASLSILYPECELIRTRDEARIAEADFAVDVGGIWDPQKGRFDHHQKGFNGARQSGVIYASAGLVWKEYGAQCVATIAQSCCACLLEVKDAQQIAYAIDGDIVQYLDMADTGAAKNAPGGYGLSALISGFNPTWLDEQHASNPEAAEQLRQRQFLRAADFMQDIIKNAVKYRVGAMQATQRVRESELLENGKILFLRNGAMPWSAVVRNEMPNVLFVLGYSIMEDRYLLNTVPLSVETFKARRDLPADWAGLRDKELAAVTGIPDAIFCHNNLFICAAKSFDGALKLARQALARS
ncbi:MAG: MYG1 family protein [Burkholderiaceae bacterium]